MAIPWNKFPTSLNEALKNGKPPSFFDMKQMVTIVVSEMFNFTCKPTRKQLWLIAHKIISKAPPLFSDVINGIVVGDGMDTLMLKLESKKENIKRFENLNKSEKVPRVRGIKNKAQNESDISSKVQRKSDLSNKALEESDECYDVQKESDVSNDVQKESDISTNVQKEIDISSKALRESEVSSKVLKESNMQKEADFNDHWKNSLNNEASEFSYLEKELMN